MPISHRFRSIFVHIPKTGGSSIECSLDLISKRNEPDRDRLYGRIGSQEKNMLNCVSNFYQHLTYTEILKIHPNLLIDNYTSFSIVRNPWERFVSTFANIDENLLQQARGLGIELENLNFKEFVLATQHLRHVHLLPQWHFIASSTGTILVNDIIRFEAIDVGFSQLSKNLKLDAKLPFINQSKHRPYQQYYDHETIEIIRMRYQRDIDLLNYAF